MSDVIEEYVDVVVIGAGVAGLSAAVKLKKMHKLSVMVVEATAQIGGRIKTGRLSKFFQSDEVVNLGAELLHGAGHVLKEIVDTQGWECNPMFVAAHGDGGPTSYPVGKDQTVGSYFFEKEKLPDSWLSNGLSGPHARDDKNSPVKEHARKCVNGKPSYMLPYDSDNADFQLLNDTFAELCTLKVSSDDKRTLLQYLRDDVKLSDDMLQLAEASYANTVCSTLDKLSLYEVTQLEKYWRFEGDLDYALPGGSFQYIEWLYGQLSPVQLKLNWPVKTVDVSSALEKNAKASALQQKFCCRVVNADGKRVIRCRSIVVTVPPSLLVPALEAHWLIREDCLEFQPPLPSPHLDILRQISLQPAYKIFLFFKKRFWPKQLGATISANSVGPEMAFIKYERNGVKEPLREFKNGEPFPRFHYLFDRANNNPATAFGAGLDKVWCVAVFTTAMCTRRLADLGPVEQKTALFAQLDSMFLQSHNARVPTKDMKVVAELGPWRGPLSLATKKKPIASCAEYFIDMYREDWGCHKRFITGGYSSTGHNITPARREELAQPVLGGRVVLAGEAYNIPYRLVAHAAMESGNYAARGISSALHSIAHQDNLQQQEKSKL